MIAKSSSDSNSLSGEALIKETNRRIRVAMAYWKAHNNRACRGERDKALILYNQLTKEQKDKIPQQLRIWLRYRSEKYFGEQRTAPGTKQGKAKSPKSSPKSSTSSDAAPKRLPHQHKPSPGRKKKRNSKQG